MVTKKVKEEVKVELTLQDYAINENIDPITLAGFKAYLECELLDPQDEKKLDKAYKEYLETPGFIQKEEE